MNNPKKVIDENLNNCYFLPFKTLEKVRKEIQSSHFSNYYTYRMNQCGQNLLLLQRSKHLPPRLTRSYCRWSLEYTEALKRAVCTHDWEKLHMLLLASHENEDTQETPRDMYRRAMLMLLMYHPSAKAQSLLHQYMHMMLSCRTDQDKKALTRLLVSMPPKLIRNLVKKME